MAGLDFTELVPKKKEVSQGGPVTFDDIIPNRLVQSHKPTQPVTFNEMLPEERKEKFGTYEQWNTGDRLVDRIKRASNVAENALLGDIPYVRKLLPESVQKTTPQTAGEKVTTPLLKVGRDIALYGGAGKFVKPLLNVNKVTKTGRFIAKTVSEMIKGGTTGLATAGSEDPIEIAKKTGIYGGLAAASVPAVEAVSWAGSRVVNALGKSRTLQSISEWLGTSFRENKANDLVRKRYGEINSRLIDSEKYLDKLEKSITPAENKALSFIVEAGDDQTLGHIAGKEKLWAAIKLSDNSVLRGNTHPEIYNSLTPKQQAKIIDGDLFVGESSGKLFSREEAFKQARTWAGKTVDDADAQNIVGTYVKTDGASVANDRVNGIASEIRSYLDDAHAELVRDYGTDVGFIKDYVPHIWDIPKNKEKAVINWFVTRNPHLNKRRIDTIKEGIEKFGLKPKYENITDTIRSYDQIRIKSAENFKFVTELKELESGGIKLMQRVDKAPKDWPIIDHPAVRRAMGNTVGPDKKLVISKVPVRVHPEIYDDVKAVLDTYQPGKATKVLDTANTFVKQSVLNLSLFHHLALTETAIAAGMTKDALKIWNPVKIYKAFKNGTYKTVLQQSELAKTAVKDGLNIGAISDVEGGRTLVNVLKKAEEGLGNDIIATGLKTFVRKPMEFNNKFLWDYLHTTYKLGAYNKLKSDMLKRFPDKTPELVGKEVAQFVNDTFGGQNWEVMAKTKEWQQFSRFLLLSPDWVLSTMKQAVSPFGVGATSKAGIGIRKEMGKDFWRRAIVYFGGSMNLLNYAYSKAHTGEGRFMWDNAPGKETYLFTGYNSDGTERYLRWGKQFRELAEAMQDPPAVAGRKISPLIRITKTQVWPSEVWQKEIVDNPFWSEAGLTARAKQVGKDVTPYSVTQQSRMGEFNPLSFAMPISRGMTPSRARKMFRTALVQQDKKLFQRVYKSSLDSEIDPEPIFKQAISSIKAEKRFEARVDAKEIIIKYNKLGDERGALYLETLESQGKITPLLKKEIFKILKTKKTARQKKKQFEKMMEGME